ncbi:MAG: hypothetical protein HYY40_11710 [Bacteroidetes bacterium]|nr:hypothetical protein [Bacteroidota bacterium]
MKKKKTAHPYIPYLLEDIAAAHRDAGEAKLHEPKTIEEELEESERFVFDEREHTLGYYCGLKTEDFPPAEQLSNSDLKKVCKAFEEMLFSWNHTIDIPKKLPPSFAYKLMVDCLNKKTFIPDSGICGFDFCTGYAPECELKEYCPCLKIWNEKEN